MQLVLSSYLNVYGLHSNQPRLANRYLGIRSLATRSKKCRINDYMLPVRDETHCSDQETRHADLSAIYFAQGGTYADATRMTSN